MFLSKRGVLLAMLLFLCYDKRSHDAYLAYSFQCC